MNSTIPPTTSGNEGRESFINRLMEGELLDLYAAVLIVVPIAGLLRLL